MAAAKLSEESKCPICYMRDTPRWGPEKLMLMAYVVGVGNAVQEIMDKQNSFVAQVPLMCEPHRKATISIIAGYVQSSMLATRLDASKAQDLVKCLFGLFGVATETEVIPAKESMQ